MRLLTHNYLRSNVKGSTSGYPLIIKAESLVYEESPFDSAMVLRLLPKLNYPALRQACEQLKEHDRAQEMTLPDLPDQLPMDKDVIDDALQQKLHRVLFDFHVEEGFLICPDTGRQYPIKEGIPNMILHEDEL